MHGNRTEYLRQSPTAPRTGWFYADPLRDLADYRVQIAPLIGVGICNYNSGLRKTRVQVGTSVHLRQALELCVSIGEGNVVALGVSVDGPSGEVRSSCACSCPVPSAMYTIVVGARKWCGNDGCVLRRCLNKGEAMLDVGWHWVCCALVCRICVQDGASRAAYRSVRNALSAVCGAVQPDAQAKVVVTEVTVYLPVAIPCKRTTAPDTKWIGSRRAVVDLPGLGVRVLQLCPVVGALCRIVGKGRDHRLVIVLKVHLPRQTSLLHVRKAAGGASFLASLGENREQDRCQNGDDCDDDEEFNQRETRRLSAVGSVGHLRDPPNKKTDTATAEQTSFVTSLRVNRGNRLAALPCARIPVTNLSVNVWNISPT